VAGPRQEGPAPHEPTDRWCSRAGRLAGSHGTFQDTAATGERGIDRRRFTRVEIDGPRLHGVVWISVPDTEHGVS
jgi:hypothetical protein